jgi:hypothetical protein
LLVVVAVDEGLVDAWWHATTAVNARAAPIMTAVDRRRLITRSDIIKRVVRIA